MKHCIFLLLLLTYSCQNKITSDLEPSASATIETAESSSENEEMEDEITISVQWLGISCFCANWIEYQHLPKLKDDVYGKMKDKYGIHLVPSDSSNNFNNSAAIKGQTPLVLKLKGRYFKDEQTHSVKGMTFTSRTFRYDESEMIEY